MISQYMEVKKDTIKNKLDDWLKDIQDTPKIDDYGAIFGAVSMKFLVQFLELSF